MAAANEHAWSFIARTYLFDRFVARLAEAGVDLVVNLAAGLDTRPYRMDLPASLRWVEVDLPDILDYKESILGDAAPACAVERVPPRSVERRRAPRAVRPARPRIDARRR